MLSLKYLNNNVIMKKGGTDTLRKEFIPHDFLMKAHFENVKIRV